MGYNNTVQQMRYGDLLKLESTAIKAHGEFLIAICHILDQFS